MKEVSSMSQIEEYFSIYKSKVEQTDRKKEMLEKQIRLIDPYFGGYRHSILLELMAQRAKLSTELPHTTFTSLISLLETYHPSPQGFSSASTFDKHVIELDFYNMVILEAFKRRIADTKSGNVLDSFYLFKSALLKQSNLFEDLVRLIDNSALELQRSDLLSPYKELALETYKRQYELEEFLLGNI